MISMNEVIEQDDVSMDMRGNFKRNALDTDTWADIQGKIMAQSDQNYTSLTEYDLADTYHALYSPEVSINENATDPVREEWWVDFFGKVGPAVRDMTRLDSALSEQVTWGIARKLQKYIQDSVGDDASSVRSQAKRLRYIEDSYKEVEDIIDEARDLGELHLDPEELKDAYGRASKNRRVKAILQLAGQMLRFAYGKRKERGLGLDRVGGIEYAGDLSRLISQEYANLAVPELELDFYRRFIEKQTLSTRRFREDPMGRGPVVVVVDESGSMGYNDGQSIIQAKALSLALAQLAKQDKRWIHFVGFASHLDDLNQLTMKPDEWDSSQLMQWVGRFDGGGTDYGVLNKIADDWSVINPPEGKTDVVFITDGHCQLESDARRQWNEWRSLNQVRCYGICIGLKDDSIKDLCDESWSTYSLGIDDEPTKRILSEV